MRRAARAAGAVLAALAAGYLLAVIAIPAVGLRDGVRPADAVLVLGMRAYVDGRPNPCLVARVRHGAALVRGGVAPLLVVSGGTDREDGRNEARVMRGLAVREGVPPARVRLEDRSTSTRENMELGRAVLAAAGARRVVVVTEPYHAPRAAWLARRAGLDATVSPARGSPCAVQGALREPFALLWNLLSAGRS